MFNVQLDFFLTSGNNNNNSLFIFKSTFSLFYTPTIIFQLLEPERFRVKRTVVSEHFLENYWSENSGIVFLCWSIANHSKCINLKFQRIDIAWSINILCSRGKFLRRLISMNDNKCIYIGILYTVLISLLLKVYSM